MLTLPRLTSQGLKEEVAMADVVWKFPLSSNVDGDTLQMVEMPEGAELLGTAAQGNRIGLWARVDPQRPKVTRSFFVVGTGQPSRFMTPEMHSRTRPVGVAIMTEGVAIMTEGRWLVWHVFEVLS